MNDVRFFFALIAFMIITFAFCVLAEKFGPWPAAVAIHSFLAVILFSLRKIFK